MDEPDRLTREDGIEDRYILARSSHSTRGIGTKLGAKARG